MNRTTIAFAAAASLLAAVSSAGAATMAMGSYECWGPDQRPRLLMNFTVTGPGTYKGSDDSIGHFTLTGSSVDFTNGTLNGVMPAGSVSKYEVRQGFPTVSFVGPSGAEAQFCEHVK